MTAAPAEAGPRAGAPAGSGRRPSPLLAFAELRARLLLRRLRGRGGIPELVARIALFVGGGARGARLRRPRRRGRLEGGPRRPRAAARTSPWRRSSSASGRRGPRSRSRSRSARRSTCAASSSTQSRPGGVFAYGLAASVIGDPFAMFWSLMLGGAFLGGALARPGAWVLLLALAYALFVVATASFVALLQELLARLLRGRRVRELAIASVYLGTALLVVFMSGGPRAALQAFRVLAYVRWIAFPAALAERAVVNLYAARTGAALGWLLLLALGGGGRRVGRLPARARGRAHGRRPGAAGGGDAARAAGACRVGSDRSSRRRGSTSSATPSRACSQSSSPRSRGSSGGSSCRGSRRRRARSSGRCRSSGSRSTPTSRRSRSGSTPSAGSAAAGGPGSSRRSPRPTSSSRRTSPPTSSRSRSSRRAQGRGSRSAVRRRRGRSSARSRCTPGSPPGSSLAGNLVSILNPRPAPHTIQRGGHLSPVSALAGMAIFSAGVALFSTPVLGGDPARRALAPPRRVGAARPPRPRPLPVGAPAAGAPPARAARAAPRRRLRRRRLNRPPQGRGAGGPSASRMVLSSSSSSTGFTR